MADGTVGVKRSRTGKGKKGTGKRTVLLFLLKHAFLAGTAFVLASLLFLFTMDRIIMPFYIGIGKEFAAPDFRGKTVEEARRAASNRLVIRVEKTDYHNEYPENTIYLQIPSPGTKIKPGRKIRVFVSKGPKPITVPDVVGTSPRNARTAVKNAGLAVREVAWIPSNEYPYGIVAAQYPEANSEVPDTTGVILYISNGRKVMNVVMPDLQNMSLSAARDTLRARGFHLSFLRIQREEQPDLLPNTVIEQYPSPGVPASTTEEVILIVSTAAEEEK